MSTQTRLLLLFFVLVAVFGATVWVHHRSHVREAEAMLANMKVERGELLDSIVELNGLSLKNFAYDYSYWDELVAFLDNPKPEWSKVNLEASLPTFELHGVWVMKTDGTVLYSADRGIERSIPSGLVPIDQIVAQLEADKFVHFFIFAENGVFEFRGAPIQPSADAARATKPLGWLLAARQWDENYRARLGKILRSEIAITAPAAPASDGAGKVVIERKLHDHRGTPVASLRTVYEPGVIALLTDENRGEQVVFLVFGVVLILCIIFGVGRWVVIPLRKLELSLTQNTSKPLDELATKPDEFGRLARLVSASFDQRANLVYEVEERRRAESALRRSEDDVRNSADLQSRLARDLHDGVIQSLYAAGLGLEGARGMLREEPVSAERRIEAVQQTLNQTIREVRGFINGLEPETRGEIPFAQALRALVTTLQSFHGVPIVLETPGGKATALTPAEEVHALQIVREAVSNALRHGQPKSVTVSLQQKAGERRLSIRDDGRGFDPNEIERRGHSGLANLAARANEIGGRLTVESAPGKGTRVILTFQQSSGT